MSWIVETFLLDREKIRSLGNLNDDDYNNLLLLEKRIKELTKKNVFSPLELDILEEIYNNKNIKTLYVRLGVSKKTFYTCFKTVCEKIAFSLGGYFTDEGYIRYMSSKYNLTEDQEVILKAFIKSKYRHKTPIHFIPQKDG
jgi:hypothetical protein